jgi:hypothetical protein
VLSTDEKADRQRAHARAYYWRNRDAVLAKMAVKRRDTEAAEALGSLQAAHSRMVQLDCEGVVP